MAVALQPLWDILTKNTGSLFNSPGYILTAVMLGVYIPGIFFSVIDVFISKRLTIQQCFAVYWRAMKWYSTLYVVLMPAILIFLPSSLRLNIPPEAPSFVQFSKDVILYFLLGDFTSYWWHE
jgi:hypothetical protein